MCLNSRRFADNDVVTEDLLMMGPDFKNNFPGYG